MVQVNGESLKFQIAPVHSRVVQPGSNLVVFTTPTREGFVEAVDADEIAFPVRLIAATDRVLSGALAENQSAQQETAHYVAAAPDVRREETQVELPLCQHPTGRPWTCEQPHTLDETAVPGGAHVVGDKVLMQHHVTVHDDHVVPGSRRNGPIARARQPESLVGLPHVA